MTSTGPIAISSGWFWLACGCHLEVKPDWWYEPIIGEGWMCMTHGNQPVLDPRAVTAIQDYAAARAHKLIASEYGVPTDELDLESHIRALAEMAVMCGILRGKGAMAEAVALEIKDQWNGKKMPRDAMVNVTRLADVIRKTLEE